MQAKTAAVLRVLINRFHRGATEALVGRLTKEEGQAVAHQSFEASDISLFFANPSEVIDRIHYSWLSPAIEKLPSDLQQLYVAALPEATIINLNALMKQSFKSVAYTDLSRKYILTNLYSNLQETKVLPRQLLTGSPLAWLLDQSKAQLVELVDFLGLHDLADELRHIVDKNKLNKVYQFLSSKQKQYLRMCLHQKMRIAAPKLALEKWDGDGVKLARLLHRRGLARLGKAFGGQHLDFLWHIVHVLDVGRGSILQKYYAPEETAGVTQVLRYQLTGLIKFLQTTGA